MSSGIEIILLAPLLLPGLMTTGGAVTSGAIAATGGVAVSGSSVVTTGAFAAGSMAGAGGTAAGAATGVAMLGGAVLVVGAAGAALLAAQHMHSTYQTALSDYRQRVDDESAEFVSATQANRTAADAAHLLAHKAKVKAAESAELAFLRAGVKRLQIRLGSGSSPDPRLPGACAQLLRDIENPSPQIAKLFADYEGLSASVAAWFEKNRRELAQIAASSRTTEGVEALRAVQELEIAALREELQAAPPKVLLEKTRIELYRALIQVEHLLTTQPVMAEQSLKLLRGRVGRELSSGAMRAEKEREEQQAFSEQLRDMVGRISARSQATLSVLENEELANSPLARFQIEALQSTAREHLRHLATHLSGDSSDDLSPLERLAREADTLFETTADQLRQIALQIYLESQVAEVFTQLGYRVTSVENTNFGSSSIVAALDGGRGVEVRLDGQGNLQSELVAFSSSSSEIEPEAQEKVCVLMDDVFEALRSRGCGVREKKRRHFKKGERSLRVVKENKKKSVQPPPGSALIQRRVDG